MTVKFAVSYEFQSKPPATFRGTVSGSQVATCVSRATRQAQRSLRPKGWTSYVCVLLERLDAPVDDAAGALAAVVGDL